MLSKDVTCAIKIFHVLYHSSQTIQGRKLVFESTLEQACKMDYSCFRRVFVRLLKYSYLDHINDTVVLLKTLSDVSVYELCYLFHGGIPIGEEIEQDYNELDYQANPSFPALVHFELDMKRFAEKRLKKITLESIFQPFSNVSVAEK